MNPSWEGLSRKYEKWVVTRYDDQGRPDWTDSPRNARVVAETLQRYGGLRGLLKVRAFLAERRKRF